MPNELELLSNKVNNCSNLKNDDLKKEFVDFVGSLDTSRHKFGSYLRLLDDLKTQLTNKELDCLISVLSEAIKIDNVEIRKNSIEALGVLEKLADRTVPQLVQLMKNEPVDEVRGQVANTLANIGSTDFQQILKLIKYIEDPYPLTQKGVIIALSKLKEGAAPAIPKLQKILHNSSNTEVTAEAISCLGEIGHKASEVAQTLISYLKQEKEKDLRRAAAQSLTLIGKISEEAIDDLFNGLKHYEELDLRIACTQALGKSNTNADKVVIELSKYLNDEDLQIEVIKALSQINSVFSAKVLSEMLLKDNPYLVVEDIHRMTPDGFWQAKPNIILDAINQESLSAQAYASLAIPLFYVMLPPSERRINQEQNSSDVSELCQILIGRAVKDKTNTKLVLVIANLISQGARLGPKGAQLQIDSYVFSHNTPSEDIYQLRVYAGDTSDLENKISELEDKLGSSLKEELEALKKELKENYTYIVKQYNWTVFRNNLIFSFGFVVGVISAVYVFYSLFFSEKVDIIKSILSGGGTLTGFITLYTYLFTKPQEQTAKALKDLLQYKAVMVGFAQDFMYTAENLKLLSRGISSFDDIQKGSLLIRSVYENVLQALEKNKISE